MKKFWMTCRIFLTVLFITCYSNSLSRRPWNKESIIWRIFDFFRQLANWLNTWETVGLWANFLENLIFIHASRFHNWHDAQVYLISERIRILGSLSWDDNLETLKSKDTKLFEICLLKYAGRSKNLLFSVPKILKLFWLLFGSIDSFST